MLLSKFRLILLCLITIQALTSELHAKEEMKHSKHNQPQADHYLDSQFTKQNSRQIELGKLLMFDKILSGNQNISCASCHHPLTGLGDGLALPIGEGGQGLGVTRNTGFGSDAVAGRVPRNAPHLFNLGAAEFTDLFYDGRVAKSLNHPSGFISPAGNQLPYGLKSVLAAQAMFPVTSGLEMAGQSGENSIADAAIANQLSGNNGVWDQLAKRLQNIPEYVELFKTAFDDIQSSSDITFVHAVNAISAFETAAWRCTDTVYDRYLNAVAKGEDPSGIASQNALDGAKLFYGKANCATCHSGHFQTDQKYHAIGIPQIGPGKGDNIGGYHDGADDFGRERVTGQIQDRYKFRTPSLRQVVLTGPWGHDGAFNTLQGVIKHHLDALNSLYTYDINQVILPSNEFLDSLDFIIQDSPDRVQSIANSISPDLKPVDLTKKEIAHLMDFLETLTDQKCIDLRKDVPNKVPSGLPIFE